MNQLFDIFKNILIIVLPKPETFGILIIVSWLAILSGLLSFLYYYKKYRVDEERHLAEEQNDSSAKLMPQKTDAVELTVLKKETWSKTGCSKLSYVLLLDVSYLTTRTSLLYYCNTFWILAWLKSSVNKNLNIASGTVGIAVRSVILCQFVSWQLFLCDHSRYTYCTYCIRRKDHEKLYMLNNTRIIRTFNRVKQKLRTIVPRETLLTQCAYQVEPNANRRYLIKERQVFPITSILQKIMFSIKHSIASTTIYKSLFCPVIYTFY